jgi:hypothetical protein
MKHVPLLAAAVLLAPAIASADDLSGAWKFQATGPKGGAAIMTCTLTRTGNDIAGPCVTPQGSTVDISGTVSGTNVDFGYNLAGSPLHVGFTGVIQPDGSIKGTVSASTPPAAFTGTKQ